MPYTYVDLTYGEKLKVLNALCELTQVFRCIGEYDGGRPGLYTAIKVHYMVVDRVDDEGMRHAHDEETFIHILTDGTIVICDMETYRPNFLSRALFPSKKEIPKFKSLRCALEDEYFRNVISGSWHLKCDSIMETIDAATDWVFESLNRIKNDCSALRAPVKESYSKYKKEYDD